MAGIGMQMWGLGAENSCPLTGSGGQLAGGTAPLSAKPAFYLERNSKSISKVAQVTSCTPGLILPFFFKSMFVCIFV